MSDFFDDDEEKKYWFDPDTRTVQMKQIGASLVCLHHLLEETIREQSPNKALTDLLCEYITNANNFKALMKELELYPKLVNMQIDKEQYMLDKTQVDLMKAQVQLIMFNDYDLYTKWGFNLTIH
tara:strand:- start:2762 stop:3133 length:372 start_codon:yes stop_codon:yes gene_type:complete